MATFDDYEPATLRTPLLALEPLRVAHADEMFANLSNPDHYKFIPQNPPASLQIVRERFGRLENCRSPNGEQLWLNWAIRLATGEAAGLIQATVLQERRAIIAYELFAPFQGRGLATEALRTALQHLTDKAGILIASALVDTRNMKSIRLLERLGFTRKRFIKDADTFKGSSSDEFEYELVIKR